MRAGVALDERGARIVERVLALRMEPTRRGHDPGLEFDDLGRTDAGGEHRGSGHTGAEPDHQGTRTGIGERAGDEPEQRLRLHVRRARVHLATDAQPQILTRRIGAEDDRGVDALAVVDELVGRTAALHGIGGTAREREIATRHDRTIHARRHHHGIPRRRGQHEQPGREHEDDHEHRREPAPRALHPRHPRGHEPDDERDRDRAEVRALHTERRHQHETREQRTGDRADRVERVAGADRMAAVAALQQPHRHREQRTEQHARQPDDRGDGERLGDQQPAPIDARGRTHLEHALRQPRERMHRERRAGGESGLQQRETRERRAALDPTSDERRSEGDAEQVDPEHRRERVDRRAEHEPEQPHPRDLERERAEAREREQQCDDTPRAHPEPIGRGHG